MTVRPVFIMIYKDGVDDDKIMLIVSVVVIVLMMICDDHDIVGWRDSWEICKLFVFFLSCVTCKIEKKHPKILFCHLSLICRWPMFVHMYLICTYWMILGSNCSVFFINKNFVQFLSYLLQQDFVDEMLQDFISYCLYVSCIVLNSVHCDWLHCIPHAPQFLTIQHPNWQEIK